MKLKDNRARGRWILNAFYVLMILLPIIIVSDFLEYNLLQREVFSTEEGEASDLRQGVLGIVQVVMTIITATFFIMWFRRAYFNLHTLKVNLQYTEGWAAGSWFVPILNLFRPYQIMEEIWVNTQVQIDKPEEEPKILLGVWWGLWIIGGIIDRISTRLALDASTIENYQTSSLLTLISDAFSLITLFCIIFIIRKVIVWEEELYQKHNEMQIEDHLI